MLTLRQMKSLESSVSRRIVARAQPYIAHAVSIVSGDAHRVEATVTGSEPYAVQLQVESDGFVAASCTCPFFLDRDEPCKHVWAALVVATERGHLDGLGAFDDPELVTDLPSPYDDDLDPANASGQPLGYSVPPPPYSRSRPAAPSRREPWRVQLDTARMLFQTEAISSRQRWPEDGDLRFELQPNTPGMPPVCALRAVLRVPRRKGGWTKPRAVSIVASDVASLPLPPDLRILVARLIGGHQAFTYSYGPSLESAVLSRVLAGDVLPGLCAAGLVVLAGTDEPQPLAWDDGPAWRPVVDVSAATDAVHRVTAALERENERLPLDQCALHTPVVRVGTTLSLLDAGGAEKWLQHFANARPADVPAASLDEWLTALGTLPHLPPLRLAPELGIAIDTGTPSPALDVHAPRHATMLSAELTFAYGEGRIHEGPGSAVYDAAGRMLLVRDREREAGYIARLDSLGARQEPIWPPRPGGVQRLLAPAALATTVSTLVSEGWRVSIDGTPQRTLSRVDAELTSGIDWFDLAGAAWFGDVAIPLPELLAALERGHGTVTLPDGSQGFVPDEVAREWRMAARLGRAERGKVRLTTAEALLLDQMLDPERTTRSDPGLEALRTRIASYEGTADVREPDTFAGELRPYQRDGLRWFATLRDLGLGGCLADDMGLGKTVMVLAWLEHLRRLGLGTPSLVVVPRSVVFNWIEEARRFTPALRVLDLSHASRAAEYANVPHVDLAISTYGTLRRDVAALAAQTFEYAILDEAQAIKNATTASAKAARTLQARHRLALTGTPIENRLSDLWSILDFANPVLAARGGLGRLVKGAGDATERERLARAVRPFILRRTKAQVARDLPPRTEQTVACELGPSERRLYNQLRDHYRTRLLSGAMRLSSASGRMHVLEALLRLRQAACHPGLIDPARREESSAKLDQLVEQVGEVVSEGSKALVFSQFTSMLALVRARFDEEGWAYEYLDGRTKDRQARVDRFQTDPTCPLFLVSLKAGGVGLNLTAAEYVFLLDPWWNPAVEAQAIDRTHRIGQVRPVFAYRLLSRDTVEEKVIALQEQKRALAEAIVREEEGPLASLTRDELELLLS